MELKRILEALLIAAPKPLSPSELRDALRKTGNEEDATEGARELRSTAPESIEAALLELASEHEGAGRSYRLVCVAGAWQFVTQPDFAPWVRTLLGAKSRPPRLTQPALETLAVIAYRQPATRAEIEQIRGVAVDGVIATLKERGLITEAGRAEVVGRPVQFATTAAFLEYFGLAALDGLPAADELRRIQVTRPEALLTADSQIPLPIASPVDPRPSPAPPTGEPAGEPAADPVPAAAPPADPTGPPPAETPELPA